MIIDMPEKKSVLIYHDSIASMANVQVSEINMPLYMNILGMGKGESWYGVTNINDLREIVEIYGSWPEGVNRGKVLMDNIKAPKLPSTKRKKTWGAKGGRINISRMYTGKASKMFRCAKRQFTKDRSNGRSSVNIVIDISANSSIHADSFYWRGALGCVLAKALMESGRNVRVLAAFSVGNFTTNSYYSARRNCTVMLNVKPYGQQVNYNSMFAVTALAGTLRHYFFKSVLSLDTQIKNSIGRVTSVEDDMITPIIDNNPTILIENIWDKYTAIEKAKDILGGL